MAEAHVEDDNKDGGHDEYVVEAVKNKKVVDGVTYYLIKWLGWPLEESTWEPEANCEKCDNLIQEFEDQQRQREADASARQVKDDESSNSSDLEVISDYEIKRGSRRRKKKGNRRKKSSRSKVDFIGDDNDDDDDSDFEKSRKSKKRRVKKGNNCYHESGYLSTDYLNGESTTTVDSDSSSKSKKIKEPKDSVYSNASKVKKTRLVRENEAIKLYLGTSGTNGSGARSRDKPSAVSSEDIRSKRIVSSSSCAKESEIKQKTVQNYSIKREEVVQQHILEEPPLNQSFNQLLDQPLIQPLKQPLIQSLDEPKLEYTEQSLNQENPLETVASLPDEESTDLPDPVINLKRRIRISSSDSSEEENYEIAYFGWERGKKIVEILEWYGYQDKVLHLVRYHDGEEEYVDDSYTCKRYPVLVYEMYRKYIDVELSENQKVWFNFAIQRFQEIEENGPYEEDQPQIMVEENESSGDGEYENNESGQDNEVQETGDAEEVDVNVSDFVVTEGANINTEQQEDVKSEAEEGENSTPSESGNEDNQNKPDEYFDDGAYVRDGEPQEEEEENDENNQNYHNADSSNSSSNSNHGANLRNSHEETANSVLVIDSTMEESIGQNDSVFIVHSDSSYNSQPIPINQPLVNPEFVVEESDLEDDLMDSSDTVREAIYGPICNGDTPSHDNMRVDEPGHVSSLPLFNPSPPSNWSPLDAEDEIIFNPSPSSPSAHELPVDISFNSASSASFEAPDINESDDGELNEEDLQFDPSPPTSPYQN